MDYDAFAKALLEGGVLTDPWLDGVPRFSMQPEVLDSAFWKRLSRAGERVALAYDELCSLVEEDPSALEEFFSLTPTQRVMWQASVPLWHGIARADVFLTNEGLTIAELNCDTPTGEAEAVELARLCKKPDGTMDPNEQMRARFVAMVERYSEDWVREEVPKTLGLLYPTEFTEDLSLVRLYQRWFEAAGWTVVFGSPYNLGVDSKGRTTLFDTPVRVLLRHYKTDWWGERLSAWNDERIPDVAPLTEPLRAVLGAFVEHRVAVVNPFGAVLPQNKRSMAFFWERIHRFSPETQRTIEELVPYTARLETMHPEQLVSQKEQWVLKSDYGAEGEEVVLGALVTQEVWEKSLKAARPERWIAQQFFTTVPREDGAQANYGVYVIAGETSGLYLRVQPGMTDERAKSVPVFVAQ